MVKYTNSCICMGTQIQRILHDRYMDVSEPWYGWRACYDQTQDADPGQGEICHKATRSSTNHFFRPES